MAKILIVDDNPEILQLMKLILASRGYQVEITTEGDQTFPLIQSFQPDLIFLDVFLSGLDGRDICHKIKTCEDTRQISVILFSANVLKGAALATSLADDFLAKPFDIHDLVKKVKKLAGYPNYPNTMTA